MTTDKTPETPASPRKPRRRTGKWILLAFLALVACSWLTRLRYYPGHLERAYAALPEAALVGELADDPGILWQIRLTTGDKTVACVHKATDGSVLPVLSAASYGGWRTPILRFLLVTRWIPGLGRLGKSPNGARYLRLGSKRHPSEYVVGFALEKDILLASLSKNPDDVLALRERAVEKTPPPPALAAIAPWDLPDPEHPYRFWIVSDIPALKGLPETVAVRSLSIRVDPLWKAVATIKATARCEEGGLEAVLGTSRISGRATKAESLAAPAANLLFLLPPGLTRQELDVRLFNGRRPSAPPSDKPGEDDATLYFTKAPYGTTVLGHLPLPTATLYCPGLAINATRVQNRMAEIAPISGFPTLRTIKQEGNRTYQLIDWLGRYGRHKPLRLADSECGALELPADGRDLFLCTSLKSLAAQRSSVAAEGNPWKTWITPRLRGNDGVAFAWIDYDAVLAECRQLLAIVHLAQKIAGFSPPPALQAKLDFANAFLSSFKLEGHLALLATRPEKDRLDFELELAVR